MYNVAIMGTGASMHPVREALRTEVRITQYLDNNPDKINKKIDGITIISPYDVIIEDADYIIIATMDFIQALEQLKLVGVLRETIICFYDEAINMTAYRFLFQEEIWKRNSFYVRIDVTLKRFMKREKALLQNLEYEIAQKMQKVDYFFPKIRSVEDTCKKIKEERASISRYGDGEFEIIAGNAKDPYQGNNDNLARRLTEILKSNVKNHLVALADDYGSLDNYNQDIQYAIRCYMSKEKRAFHKNLLDENKVYFNAYISRPYSIYEYEKRNTAEDRFKCLKEIWKNEEIVFVEGDTTRMGVGNDLFYNARNIKRILAPSINAYNRYDEILRATRSLPKNKLILIALGPTATVLAYDLAKDGYWALDVGHLDIEYEWFLKGKGQTYISHKYNNEIFGDDRVSEIQDSLYESQIIKKIY